MYGQQENNNVPVADEVDPELLAKVLANPEMRALLNSLAKTDHTLANKIEAPHEILRKNPVQYMNMSRIFLFTTIFFTIFPSIIRKIFHCNDYSYPPSPYICGSRFFSHKMLLQKALHFPSVIIQNKISFHYK